jgi:hypothetical protein
MCAIFRDRDLAASAKGQTLASVDRKPSQHPRRVRNSWFFAGVFTLGANHPLLPPNLSVAYRF